MLFPYVSKDVQLSFRNCTSQPNLQDNSVGLVIANDINAFQISVETHRHTFYQINICQYYNPYSLRKITVRAFSGFFNIGRMPIIISGI